MFRFERNDRSVGSIGDRVRSFSVDVDHAGRMPPVVVLLGRVKVRGGIPDSFVHRDIVLRFDSGLV